MNDQNSRQQLIEELKNTSLDVELWTSMKPHEIVSATIEAYLNHTIKIIESQSPADVPDTNVGEWIPCSERLPDKAGNYLVTSKGCTWVAHWFYHTWWGIEKECRWTDVKAWMPLPEAYKED